MAGEIFLICDSSMIIILDDIKHFPLRFIPKINIMIIQCEKHFKNAMCKAIV